MFHGPWCFFWTEFHGHLERICFCRFGVELYKCLLLSVDWWYFCLIFFCILADILPSCSINCWEKAMDFLVFLLGMHSSSLKTKIFSEFIRSDQIRSVAQSCPTLCDPMNRSTPGLPVHHQLLEFTQTHVHGVSDAIQPSHPLSSPSPPAPNPSQHQSLFQRVNSSHEVAKVLEFQL